MTVLVAAGRNAAAWNGAGIVSSTARGGGLYAVGVARSAEVVGTAGGTFAGQSVDPRAALVRFTYAGDANLNGKIDVLDYGRIDFKPALGTSGWYNGDFN